MRFWCLLMLCLMLELVSAQKGGAKGAMRNRGRGGGGAGRRGGAGRNDGDDDDDSKIFLHFCILKHIV